MPAWLNISWVDDVGPFYQPQIHLCSHNFLFRNTQQLNKQKKCQQYYYNWYVNSLKPIMVGEPVLMRLPGHNNWSQGECTAVLGPRSYEVTIGGNKYRRNRNNLY